MTELMRVFSHASSFVSRQGSEEDMFRLRPNFGFSEFSGCFARGMDGVISTVPTSRLCDDGWMGSFLHQDLRRTGSSCEALSVVFWLNRWMNT